MVCCSQKRSPRDRTGDENGTRVRRREEGTLLFKRPILICYLNVIPLVLMALNSYFIIYTKNEPKEQDFRTTIPFKDTKLV